MAKGSFIKLDRNILNWGWYKNINTKCVFIHLLLTANFKDGQFEGVKIKRGQLATSYPHLSQQTGLSIRQARTAIEHLKLTGELTVKAYPKFTVITVNNYDEYQSIDRQVDSQLTGKRHAERQSSDNNIRKKEEKKERIERIGGAKIPNGFSTAEEYERHVAELRR